MEVSPNVTSTPAKPPLSNAKFEIGEPVMLLMLLWPQDAVKENALVVTLFQ
jgi:hypothetical protein